MPWDWNFPSCSCHKSQKRQHPLPYLLFKNSSTASLNFSGSLAAIKWPPSMNFKVLLGMLCAISFVCFLLITSLVPAMTRVSALICRSLLLSMLGSLTIRPNNSVFCLLVLFAIRYPSSMGICVEGLTPCGSKLAPFNISLSMCSGYFRANTNAMFPPSENPRI